MRQIRSKFLLLFIKNCKLQIRSPGTLLLEVVVPLIVIFFFFAMSLSFPTTKHCFSTFTEKSNVIPLPGQARIAVAPSIQLSRDIMQSVLGQNVSILSADNFEYLEDADYVNTILEAYPNRFVAAILFDGLTLGDSNLPLNLSYTIRYPIISAVKKSDWNANKNPGPTDWICESGIGFCLGQKTAVPFTFLQQGQFQLQQAIDRAIIHLKTNVPLADLKETHVRQLPYPGWIENWFLVGLSESLPLMIIIGYFWNVFITTRDIVNDRDNGIREILKSIGVGNMSILGSWYCIRFLVALLVSSTVVLAIWALSIVRFSNFFLVWVTVTILSLSIINMCFLLGTFIKSTTLGMFTILISYIVSFTPFLVISQSIDTYSDTTKYICSVFSPTAAAMALHNIGQWEAQGIGLNWDTLDHCVGPSTFSALRALGMTILDTTVYAIIFIYLDAIFPGKHGIGLPWTYVFDINYWRPEDESIKDELYSNNTIEGVTSNTLEHWRGVKLTALEKHYYIRGRVVQAVNGITTHFRENEISTLLGYNGSGKTTTLKMLAAMHSPTNGKITVNGMNLATRASVIRKTLGYCPQYNILIDDLTVKEHMQLFTSLKGLHNKSWDREVDLSIKKLKFEGQKDLAVQHLSGGMKRKLSLGLALCGHPNVVILDEPTCGMDTEARKVTWDLLLDHRAGRTIIVSTHDMEEADLLSDRCFVMSDGQIIASGTATNIKAQNGLGYQLSVSVESPPTAILPLLQQFTPDARLIRKTYKEQVYAIPDTDKASLIGLLNYIENEGSSLGITGHGLMQSDLEEALVNVVKRQTSRVADEDDYARLGCLARLRYWVFGNGDDAETIATNNTRKSGTSHKKYPVSGFYRSCDRYAGFLLGFHRLQTLIRKRVLETCRDKLGIALKLVIPALLVFFSIIFLQANRTGRQMQYTLNVGGLAGEPDALVTADFANTGIFNINNSKLLSTENVEFVDWKSRVEDSIANDYNSSNCCDYRFLQLRDSCDSTPWNSTVWEGCSEGFGYHHCFEDCFQRDVLLNYQGCPPGRRPGDAGAGGEVIDFFQNYFLNKSVGYVFKKYHNHALTSSLTVDGALQLTAWFSKMRSHSVAQSLNIMNNMLLGYYSNNTAGHITTSFWPYQTLSDTLTQAAEVSLPLIIFSIFTTFAATFVSASFSLFLVKERVTKMKHLQLMTGISGRVYWYANLIWDFLTYAIFTIAVLLLLAAFNISEFSGEYGFALLMLLLSFGFAAIPITYLLTKLIDSSVLCFAVICSAGFSLCMCGIMMSLYVNNEELHSILSLVPYAALGMGIVDLYVNKNLVSYKETCSGDSSCVSGYVDSPFSVESPGVGMQILLMVIEGCIFSVLLVSLEELSAFIQLYYLREDVRKLTKEESDVSRERRKIREVQADSFPVVVNSISKTLQNNLIVNNISFGMQKKQCVGLLGHNGAGKSTLFSILSGEVLPTWGSVNLFGTNMLEDLRGYRERVGYCPQEPATFPSMTGREVLALFCGLRGLRKERTEEIVSKLLAWTGFARYADRVSGTYSGGTLRKLSLAISLIGDPPVLLLDEPSASVDPTSRRLMWKLLRQLADSDKSILLSTHIKGEVEAVCDKIVVLNKGNAIAIGSCNQVRDKFGSGFCLQISTADPTEVELTKAALEQRLKNVKFVHRVGRHLQYFVPKSSFTYSDVFIAVELLKHLVKLDHYSVCQLAFTQLDFLNKLTDDNRENLESFLRRIHGFVRKSLRRSNKKQVKGYITEAPENSIAQENTAALSVTDVTCTPEPPSRDAGLSRVV